MLRESKKFFAETLQLFQTRKFTISSRLFLSISHAKLRTLFDAVFLMGAFWFVFSLHFLSSFLFDIECLPPMHRGLTTFFRWAKYHMHRSSSVACLCGCRLLIPPLRWRLPAAVFRRLASLPTLVVPAHGCADAAKLF